MTMLHSARVTILAIICISLIHLTPPPLARADDPLTFSGTVWTFISNTVDVYRDQENYTVYAETGQTVTLDFRYWGYCNYATARLDISIGELVGSFIIPPNGEIGAIGLNETQSYSRLIARSGAVQITIAIEKLIFASFIAGCTVDYELVVNGATLEPPPPPVDPVVPIDPIITAEEAAGLQRVQDNSLPVVIYTPMPDNPDRFIDIRDLEGNPILYISADDLAALPEFPAENILIASEGLVSIYKLTTGEYQVNVGPLPDGKVHVIIFDAVPRTHTYGYTWTPMPE